MVKRAFPGPIVSRETRTGGAAAEAGLHASRASTATSKTAARRAPLRSARAAPSAVLPRTEPLSFFMLEPDMMSTRRSSRHRSRAYNARTALAALAAGLLAAVASCGSRTELWMNDPCGNEGEEHACEGVCGEG